MHQKFANNLENDRRYYPIPQELFILIRGIRSYFSFPERSAKKNKIDDEISKELIKINSHWTVRNVRLWFNNNKKNIYQI